MINIDNIPKTENGCLIGNTTGKNNVETVINILNSTTKRKHLDDDCNGDFMRVEEREYIEPEKVGEEIIKALNTVKEYCKTHAEFEDCRHCVIGDGIHNCGCSSPWLWEIRQ